MAKNSGPGSSSRRGRSAEGRANPKGGRHIGRYTDPIESGRYTVATPKSAKVSPRWWAPTMLGLMLVGVVTILCNYLGVFGTPSGWTLLIGLGLIASGFVMATGYR